MNDRGEGEGEKEREGVMEQKQEREERRSQLEHGAVGERPERLFCKKRLTNTHSYTHRVQKLWPGVSKAKQKHSQEESYFVTHIHTYTYTQSALRGCSKF